MSGYLYFPNNFKDIKDHIQADMISCKIFFQLMVTVFKENLNLQLLLIFYSSIRFVLKQYLFQNKLKRTGLDRTGLELCYRLMTNLSPSLMFLTIWFCSLGLKQFQNHTYDLKISGQVVLVERSQFVPQNLRIKLLKMGKDMKIKYSVSSPLPSTKYGGSFFAKKLCMAEQTFLGKFIGGCFTWGPIIRSYKEGGGGRVNG